LILRRVDEDVGERDQRVTPLYVAVQTSLIGLSAQQMPIEIGDRLGSIVRRQKALSMFGRPRDLTNDLTYRSLSISKLLSARVAFATGWTLQDLSVNSIDSAVCIRRAWLLRRGENGNENEYRRQSDCAHDPLQAQVCVRDELEEGGCKISAGARSRSTIQARRTLELDLDYR
jgi:hypothetical protein